MSIPAVTLSSEQHNRLLKLLLEADELDNPAVRDLLLADLPPSASTRLARSPIKAVDLENIVRLAENWTELVNGKPAIVMLINRAQVFSGNGGADFDLLLDDLKTSATAQRVPAILAEHRKKLLKILVSMQEFDTPEGRELLLINMPSRLTTQIKRNPIKNVDLLAIVSLVQNWTLEDGSPALYQLIDNVLIFNENSNAGKDLQKLFKKIKASVQNAATTSVPVPIGVAIQAAEIAVAVPQPLLKLKPQQLSELHKAMLSAFPSKISLARMLLFEMGEQLESVAAGDNLGDLIFEVLQWAGAQGRLRELITASLAAVPGNPELVAFSQKVGVGVVQRTSNGKAPSPTAVPALQLKQLQAALLSAFPKRKDLQRMVLFGLGENLDSISGAGNLESAVTELLQWSEANGKIGGLVVAALEANPGNPDLTAFAAQLGVVTAPATAAAGVQGVPQPITPAAGASPTPGRMIATQELHDQLIDLLLRVPVAASFEGRSAFLRRVPIMSLNRTSGNARLDLMMIIDQLDSLGQLASGEWPLLLMIDDAVPFAPGTKLKKELLAVRETLAKNT
jgi:hypothetical protein